VIKGLTLRHVYLANAALVALLLSGGIGFFLAREFPGGPSAASAPPAQPLPPGVTRLPQANFQAWTLNCLQNPQGAKHCELALRAFDPKQNGVVLQLLATRGGNGRPFLAIMTPSNAALGPGVRLVFGNQGTTVPFRNCTVQACQAITPLDGPMLYFLNKTPDVQVAYNVASGQPINYRLPATGFDKGYAAWQGMETGLPAVPTEPPTPAAPATPAAGAAKPATAAAAKPKTATAATPANSTP
jgi:invasion protein IalB